METDNLIPHCKHFATFLAFELALFMVQTVVLLKSRRRVVRLVTDGAGIIFGVLMFRYIVIPKRARIRERLLTQFALILLQFEMNRIDVLPECGVVGELFIAKRTSMPFNVGMHR